MCPDTGIRESSTSWRRVSQQIKNKQLTIECIVLSAGQALSVSEAGAARDQVEKNCKIITARQGIEREDALWLEPATSHNTALFPVLSCNVCPIVQSPAHQRAGKG